MDYNLFEEFSWSEVESFVGPTKPVAVEHLLSVGSCPKPFDQVYVIIHITLSGFDIDHVTDTVRHLVKTQLVS